MTTRQARRLHRIRAKMLSLAKRADGADDVFAKELRESASSIKQDLRAGGFPVENKAPLVVRPRRFRDPRL